MDRNKKRHIIRIIFICYVLLLSKFILFKSGYHVDMIHIYNINERIGQRVNVHPFLMIHNYLISHVPIEIKLANIVGNIVGFIPMAILLPLMCRTKHSVIVGVIVPVGISVFYEGVQFITGLGSTDIDDVILNATGAVVGFLLLQFISFILWIKNKWFYFTSS